MIATCVCNRIESYCIDEAKLCTSLFFSVLKMFYLFDSFYFGFAFVLGLAAWIFFLFYSFVCSFFSVFFLVLFNKKGRQNEHVHHKSCTNELLI